MLQGLKMMIRKQDASLNSAYLPGETSADWSIIGDGKELELRGSQLSPYCFPFVIEHIMNGDLKQQASYPKTFPLDEWEAAFDCATGKYGDFKIAITF